MNPWLTFYMVRPPSMVALMAALLIWTTWWLADQFTPTITGLEIAPLPLAFLVSAAFCNMFRLPDVIGNLHRIKQDAAIAFGVAALVLLTLGYLLTLDDRTTQIVYTCAMGFLGIAYLGFGLCDADTIRRTSQDQTMPLYVYSGPYAISGLGLIGKAIMSALLMDHVSMVVWVFAISIGALFYDYLIRWVAVLWLMTQPDE